MKQLFQLQGMRPRFRHVGYTVKDIRSAAETLSHAFPMADAWKFCVCTMPAAESSDGKTAHLIIGLSRVNGTDIELIQAMPDTPDCYHAQLPDWSMHCSFVFHAQDYDAYAGYLTEHGFHVEWGANQSKNGEKCFYFAPKDGGPVLEFNNLFPEDPAYASLDEALQHL